jgi:hypothetical protein
MEMYGSLWVQDHPKVQTSYTAQMEAIGARQQMVELLVVDYVSRGMDVFGSQVFCLPIQPQVFNGVQMAFNGPM